MKLLQMCPRCRKRVLDLADYGESGLYKSRHLIYNPCFEDEDAEMETKGTNNIPETLASYGPPNDFSETDYY